MYVSRNTPPKRPPFHSGNVCQWIDWRIHPRATRLRLNVDEWGAWGPQKIGKILQPCSQSDWKDERVIMSKTSGSVAFFLWRPGWGYNQAGLQRPQHHGPPNGRVCADLHRRKNEPRNDEGNLEGGSRRRCYYVMFWQVLQFFQSFFWNDYHDISTVYWNWYPLISVYPGFIVSENHLFDRNAESEDLKIAPKVANSRLVAMLLEAQRWMTWYFLHLTSIRTSIRVHPFFQQSIFQVLNPVKPGVARFNYCNFWYVPWDTLCTAPAGAFLKRWRRMESWQGFFVDPCEAWRPQLWTRDGMRWWMRVTWTSPWSISDESETSWMKGSKWNAVIQMCVSKWKHILPLFLPFNIVQ